MKVRQALIGKDNPMWWRRRAVMRGLVAAAVVGLLAAGCWYLWMEDAESEASRKEDNQPHAPETKKSEPAGMYAPQILTPTSCVVCCS